MITLDSPIEVVAGVGPAIAAKLHSRGINIVRDLLSFTPMRYIDFSHPKKSNSLMAGKWAVISGTITGCHQEHSFRKRMAIIKAEITDDAGKIEAVWFNQPFLTQILRVGRPVRLHGLVIQDQFGKKILRNPEIQLTADGKPEVRYSTKSGIESGRFKHIINSILPLTDSLPDPLPPDLLKKLKLISLSQALRWCHQPEKISDVTLARTRLAIDELWTLMVLTKLTKQQNQAHPALKIAVDETRVKNDVDRLPFKLTDGQNKAIGQILSDISKTVPMRRLLNGDVGSGKTVVAMLACHQAILSGWRAIMIAPTVVLAWQHIRNWQKLYPNVPSFIFTGNGVWFNGQKIKTSEIKSTLDNNPAAFICGTHAVFSPELELVNNTALVIVDEQHRFGVMQRAFFSQNPKAVPHLLSMSATPIPRTAALVLYGDMDASILPEKPAGRIQITSKLVSDNGREMMYKFIDQLIDKGERVYIVCPLISPPDPDEEFGQFNFGDDRKTVIAEFEKLQKTVFSHRRIGLLHGKMKAAEKDAVLTSFRDGELDILITTSVIEVGVDVPEATAMVIEGAEYFGLAQLHQLRGRVGRSDKPSYCFLCAANWNESTQSRLELLVKYHDGFSLAEQDLQLRGPGELYGTIQAGVIPFKYASLADKNYIEIAKQIADEIITTPVEKRSPELESWLSTHQNMLHVE
ncbi:MAG: ATP-dependent DNA helicase RecG [Patescibacteria group bacterium]|jgi:ATP-dependent DNA helicase RecG